VKDVKLVRDQVREHFLSRFLTSVVAVELQFCDQEVTNRPEPLGPLMIVVPMSLIAVNVITTVLLAGGVKRLDTHRTLRHENLLDDLDADTSSLGSKQLRSDSHRDTEIGSKLVVGEALARLVSVFVDATAVDVLLLDIESVVFG